MENENNNEILSHLNGENLDTRWVKAIKRDKKVMKYIGDDEIECAGSLEAAIMNSIELEESNGSLFVFNLDGKKIATLSL